MKQNYVFIIYIDCGRDIGLHRSTVVRCNRMSEIPKFDILSLRSKQAIRCLVHDVTHT